MHNTRSLDLNRSAVYYFLYCPHFLISITAPPALSPQNHYHHHYDIILILILSEAATAALPPAADKADIPAYSSPTRPHKPNKTHVHKA